MSLRTRVADHHVAITFLVESVKQVTRGFKRINRKLVELEERIDSLESELDTEDFDGTDLA